MPNQTTTTTHIHPHISHHHTLTDADARGARDHCLAEAMTSPHLPTTHTTLPPDTPPSHDACLDAPSHTVTHTSSRQGTQRHTPPSGDSQGGWSPKPTECATTTMHIISVRDLASSTRHSGQHHVSTSWMARTVGAEQRVATSTHSHQCRWGLHQRLPRMKRDMNWTMPPSPLRGGEVTLESDNWLSRGGGHGSQRVRGHHRQGRHPLTSRDEVDTSPILMVGTHQQPHTHT
jgi:hypothetical protein